MVKPGLQSTPNFILSQMISQRCRKLIYSQYIWNRLIFGFLTRHQRLGWGWNYLACKIYFMLGKFQYDASIHQFQYIEQYAK